jgi:hypothetical protein
LVVVDEVVGCPAFFGRVETNHQRRWDSRSIEKYRRHEVPRRQTDQKSTPDYAAEKDTTNEPLARI